ncbi:unnamed protein product [Closterium sp. Naga37s-1]|nr:unnamed protein product [Closterium sp. Naga37s-1]
MRAVVAAGAAVAAQSPPGGSALPGDASPSAPFVFRAGQDVSAEPTKSTALLGGSTGALHSLALSLTRTLERWVLQQRQQRLLLQQQQQQQQQHGIPGGLVTGDGNAASGEAHSADVNSGGRGSGAGEKDTGVGGGAGSVGGGKNGQGEHSWRDEKAEGLESLKEMLIAMLREQQQGQRDDLTSSRDSGEAGTFSPGGRGGECGREEEVRSGISGDGDGGDCARVEQFYRLGEEVGRGHFGVVRVCWDAETGEQFACKSVLLSNVKRQEDVNELRAEICMLLRLRGHEHIVSLREVVVDAATAAVHVITEHCEGGDLFEFIARKKRLGEREAALMLRQVVEGEGEGAEGESGEAGEAGERRRVKVADFGLSLVLQRGQQVRGLAGSPFYMAPEIVKHQTYGFAVDVWSLGVVLYTALAGILPFYGKDHATIFGAICRAQPDLTRYPWGAVSGEAKHLVRRMLCATPQGRIPLAQVLLHPWMVRHNPHARAQAQAHGACAQEVAARSGPVAAALVADVPPGTIPRATLPVGTVSRAHAAVPSQHAMPAHAAAPPAAAAAAAAAAPAAVRASGVSSVKRDEGEEREREKLRTVGWDSAAGESSAAGGRAPGGRELGREGGRDGRREDAWGEGLGGMESAPNSPYLPRVAPSSPYSPIASPAASPFSRPMRYRDRFAQVHPGPDSASPPSTASPSIPSPSTDLPLSASPHTIVPHLTASHPLTASPLTTSHPTAAAPASSPHTSASSFTASPLTASPLTASLLTASPPTATPSSSSPHSTTALYPGNAASPITFAPPPLLSQPSSPRFRSRSPHSPRVSPITAALAATRATEASTRTVGFSPLGVAPAAAATSAAPPPPPPPPPPSAAAAPPPTAPAVHIPSQFHTHLPPTTPPPYPALHSSPVSAASIPSPALYLPPPPTVPPPAISPYNSPTPCSSSFSVPSCKALPTGLFTVHTLPSPIATPAAVMPFFEAPQTTAHTLPSPAATPAAVVPPPVMPPTTTAHTLLKFEE